MGPESPRPDESEEEERVDYKDPEEEQREQQRQLDEDDYMTNDSRASDTFQASGRSSGSVGEAEDDDELS